MRLLPAQNFLENLSKLLIVNRLGNSKIASGDRINTVVTTCDSREQSLWPQGGLGFRTIIKQELDRKRAFWSVDKKGNH
jgi:hypothetical protein